MWPEIISKSPFLATIIIMYAFITIGATYVSYLLYKRQLKINSINLLPGPKGLPIIGNLLDYYGPPTEHFQRVRKYICIYPCGLSRSWIGGTPRCTLYKASKVEAILNSHLHIEKSNDYTALQPWLGLGLLTSTGSRWQQRRKMLTPAFHFKILQDFIEIFNQQSSKFVFILQDKADGTPFDIFPFITLCTLDIILESAMGRNINAQGNADSDYVKAVYKLGDIVVQRQLRPWLQPNFIFKLFGYAEEQEKCLKILHNFSNETIRERRKEYQLSQSYKDKNDNDFMGKKTRLAFLDLLLESEEGDDEDIRAEVDTFMFEGHDTTAAAINWCLYLLGSHPKIQKKVFEEMNIIFGDSNRPATSADLREMKYLECCIKEALRLFPSVPAIARHLSEDVTIEGYTIPSGTKVYINKYILHRDPEYFPEPEEFKPERFLPENSVNRHPYAYVPFSAGPRNCIGQKFAIMEEKVVLSSIFRKYRIESMEKREKIRTKVDLILRPENGTLVKIFPRN